MKKTNNKKGFTIIELIVVIAIIAILAAIVLVNVTQYINKGRNAAIKGNLASLLTNSAQYYDSDATNSGTYNAFDTNTSIGCGGAGGSVSGSPIATAISGIDGASHPLVCQVRGDTGHTAFCACAMELPVAATGTVFCVDSTGNKKEVASTTCAIECPSGSTATSAICQ